MGELRCAREDDEVARKREFGWEGACCGSWEKRGIIGARGIVVAATFLVRGRGNDKTGVETNEGEMSSCSHRGRIKGNRNG